MTKILLLIAIQILIVGCVHPHKKGSILDVETPTKGQACKADEPVAKDDELNVYQEVCMKPENIEHPRTTQFIRCEKMLLGKAMVTLVADSHFAGIESKGNLILERGYTVELPKKQIQWEVIRRKDL